ncbi:aldehyde dehydrogenase family protein, partial [Agrobacterium tumefaciens]
MHRALYIDGQWVSPLKGGTFDVIDPATEQVFHTVAAGTAADIDAAVKAARRAFDAGE